MRRALVGLLLVLAVGCAPAFVPADGQAPGVTLTATEHDGFVTFRVDAAPPLERLFLRFTGTDLQANASECELVAGALECVVGRVPSFFEVSIAGSITNDPSLPVGVACRAECHPLYLE